jgi:predicted O-methyltransferase YrrM
VRLVDRVRIVKRFAQDPRDVVDRVGDRLERPSPCTMRAGDWRLFVGADTRYEVEHAALLERLDAELGEYFSDADRELSAALYSIVRARKPLRIVETGVSRGFSTRVILEAVQENRCGHLWSIDRPPLSSDFDQLWASAVADRANWTYRIGTSRRVLPSLLREVGSIGLFVHDSAHTRRNMLFEYRQAWAHLESGALLVSDDVHWNAAFETFVRERGAPSVAGKREEGGLFGIAAKS